MRGALVTLEKLTQIFPDDISLKNDLGVAHLLLGDNKGAKRVYEEVRAGGLSRCPWGWGVSDLCRSPAGPGSRAGRRIRQSALWIHSEV